MNVIFSVGCISRIRHCTKDRKNPIFCAVSDVVVASVTENHCLYKQTFMFSKGQMHVGKIFIALDFIVYIPKSSATS
jgi:hypothetical protein